MDSKFAAKLQQSAAAPFHVKFAEITSMFVAAEFELVKFMLRIIEKLQERGISGSEDEETEKIRAAQQQFRAL